MSTSGSSSQSSSGSSGSGGGRRGRGRKEPKEPTVTEKAEEEAPRRALGRGRGPSEEEGAGQEGSSEDSGESPVREFVETEADVDAITLAAKKIVIAERGKDDFGTKGRPTKLRVNYYEMKMQRALVLHHYDVIVSDRISRNADRRRPAGQMKQDRVDKQRAFQIFWEVVKDQHSTGRFPNPYLILFDGQRIVFSLAELPEGEWFFKDVKLYDEKPGPTHCGVFLEKIRTVTVSFDPATMELAADMDRANEYSKMVAMSRQILDLVFLQSKTCPFVAGDKWVATPRSVFPLPEAQPRKLGAESVLEVWSGYNIAVHPAQLYKIFLNLNVSFSAFWSLGPDDHFNTTGDRYNYFNMVYYICKCMRMQPGTDLTPNTNLCQMPSWERHRKTMNAYLKGKKIRYQYETGGENPKHMVRIPRFNLICASPAFEEKFDLNVEMADKLGFGDRVTPAMRQKLAEEINVPPRQREGRGPEVSIGEYFERKWQIQLQFPRLPPISLGPKSREVKIPMEFCFVDYPQRYNKQLADKELAEMIKLAAIPAPERMRKINELAAKSGFNQDPWVKEFNISINLEMVTVEGRVLTPPKVRTSVSGGLQEPQEGQWRWPRNGRVLNPGKIRGWGALVVGLAPQMKPQAQNFIREFHQQMAQMGIIVGQGSACSRDADKTSEIKEGLEFVRNRVLELCGFCDLILCVMPARSAELYSEIKRQAEIEIGVMTQCIILKTIGRWNNMTNQNFSFKVNCKMGGLNWEIAPVGKKNIPELITEGGGVCLVVGIDVSHPAPGDTRSRSIGSVVANIDLPCNIYGVNVKVQHLRREHLVYLQDAFVQRLLAFYGNTNTRPERIVIFRDGVSEGEYETVLRQEMRMMRQACARLQKDYNPTFTYVIVTKRHHTRLFVAAGPGCGKAQNVIPGTTVDQVVTGPVAKEYFQVSHFGIQGTSKPVKYSMIYDENNFTMDRIQELSNALTYIYQRCTRSVSIPAPVYYADLCCERARAHLYHRFGGSSGSVTDDGGSKDGRGRGRGEKSSETSSTSTSETPPSSTASSGSASGRSGEGSEGRGAVSASRRSSVSSGSVERSDQQYETEDDSYSRYVEVKQEVKAQGMYFM